MITPEQRRWRADKIGDLANYTFGALIIGQVVTSSFRPIATLIAVVIVLICWFYSDRQLKQLK